MKTTSLRFFFLLFYNVAFRVTAASAAGQTGDVDWKYYGGIENQSCFYDARGVEHAKDGHIRVWVKCLLQSDLEKFDEKSALGKKIVEATARRIADHEYPPFSLIHEIDFDAMLAIATYEVSANLANYEAQGKILYELNCSEKMSRELSISFKKNGKFLYEGNPRSWGYLAPESNGSRLHKMLCL